MPRHRYLVAVAVLAVASGAAAILGEGMVAAAAGMLALGVLAHRSRLASDVVEGEDRHQHPKAENK